MPIKTGSPNTAFKVITVVAAGLLLYIGVCGARLSFHKYGNQGAYLSNGLIAMFTGVFMSIVIAVWLVLRAILRKDKP